MNWPLAIAFLVVSGLAAFLTSYFEHPGTGNNAFTLNDATIDTKVMTDVQQGSYTVTETLPVTNFALESLTCTATGCSSGTQHAAGSPQADIVLTGGGSVTCTYVNKRLTGAIRLTKVSAKGMLRWPGRSSPTPGPTTWPTTSR